MASSLHGSCGDRKITVTDGLELEPASHVDHKYVEENDTGTWHGQQRFIWTSYDIGKASGELMQKEWQAH